LKNIVKIDKSTEFVIWLKFTQIQQVPIFIGGVYVPPQGSKIFLYSNNDDIFHDIKQDIAKYLQISPRIAICGDLNCRTGKLSEINSDVSGKDDTMILNMDTITSIHNRKSKDPIWLHKNRVTQDVTNNSYGKELIQLCQASEMRIMNGFFNAEHTSHFTCYAPLGKSAVDYLVCTEGVYNQLTMFQIHPKLVESDHTPLSFQFKIEEPQLRSNSPKNNTNSSQRLRYRYIFDKVKLPDYKNNLHMSSNQHVLYSICDQIQENATSAHIIKSMYD